MKYFFLSKIATDCKTYLQKFVIVIVSVVFILICKIFSKIRLVNETRPIALVQADM